MPRGRPSKHTLGRPLSFLLFPPVCANAKIKRMEELKVIEKKHLAYTDLAVRARNILNKSEQFNTANEKNREAIVDAVVVDVLNQFVSTDPTYNALSEEAQYEMIKNLSPQDFFDGVSHIIEFHLRKLQSAR